MNAIRAETGTKLEMSQNQEGSDMACAKESLERLIGVPVMSPKLRQLEGLLEQIEDIKRKIALMKCNDSIPCLERDEAISHMQRNLISVMSVANDMTRSVIELYKKRGEMP